MAFLRTLFWIALTVIVVVFSVRNWVPVPVNLFGDTVVETKLPMLLLIGFLIGFVPLYAWHRAVKWRHDRKLSAIERGPVSPYSSTPTPPSASAASSSSDPFQAD
jgi:putative membrane protein